MFSLLLFLFNIKKSILYDSLRSISINSSLCLQLSNFDKINKLSSMSSKSFIDAIIEFIPYVPISNIFGIRKFF